MRRDSREVQRIDQLLIRHGVLREGESIGRRLEDWGPAGLMPEQGLPEAAEAEHFRSLLSLSGHGRSYDRVAFDLLLDGHACERARSILVDLYTALAAVPIPRATRGLDNSPEEDAAFARAEKVASSKIALALSEHWPHPELFAPLILRAQRNLQEAAALLGETPEQVVKSANTQLIWRWMGGDIWTLPPLFSTIDPDLAERASLADPSALDNHRVIYGQAASVLSPRALLDYMRRLPLQDLGQAMRRARLMIEGQRRAGLDWTPEEGNLAAFMLVPSLGLSLRHFGEVMRALAKRFSLPWDDAMQARCEELDWDVLLRRYPSGEPPPP